MALVVVSGVPGSGKSTIAARLKQMGLDAWDTDTDGFAEWRMKDTKLPVAAPRDWHDEEETRGIEYCVRRDRVAELRAKSADHTVYLCGFAGGEDEYVDLFDRLIVIDVDNDTLEHRLATRTSNSYGKAAHERTAILAANVGWSESYRQRGAVIVDGTQPISAVVDAVVRAAEA